MSGDWEGDGLGVMRLQGHALKPLQLARRAPQPRPGRRYTVAPRRFRATFPVFVIAERHAGPARRPGPVGLSGPEVLLMTDPGVTVR